MTHDCSIRFRAAVTYFFIFSMPMTLDASLSNPAESMVPDPVGAFGAYDPADVIVIEDEFVP